MVARFWLKGGGGGGDSVGRGGSGGSGVCAWGGVAWEKYGFLGGWVGGGHKLQDVSRVSSSFFAPPGRIDEPQALYPLFSDQYSQ